MAGPGSGMRWKRLVRGRCARDLLPAGHVAPHKRVRACEFIDEIPKSASGKILRRVLVERERAAALSS